MNIKIGFLKAEYKLNDSEIEGFAILPTFLRPNLNLSRILEKFSYFRNESFAYDGQFILERYQQAQLVDFKEFDDKMNEYYQNQDQETNYSAFTLGAAVPVALKEIRTAFGKCFFFIVKQTLH